MNSTIGNVPSAGAGRRASSRASWMFVPPRAVISSRNFRASRSVSRDFRTGLAANGSTPSL